MGFCTRILLARRRDSQNKKATVIQQQMTGRKRSRGFELRAPRPARLRGAPPPLQVSDVFGSDSDGDPDYNILDGLSKYGYELGPMLGSSNSPVYEVKDRESLKLYAAKPLTLDSGRLTQDIVRELSLMYDVKHENIVSLHEAILFKKNCIALVMDYGGNDLTRFVDINKQLQEEKIRLYMRQILHVVAHLHGKDVVHRDLKPANVLEHNDKIKLADFGHARAFIKDQQLSPMVTPPAYMAPEMLLGWLDYTRAADLWSVGCIFAELATCTHLFYSSSRDKNEIIVQIFKRLGTPLDDRWPGVSSLRDYPSNEPTYIVETFDTVATVNEAGNDLLRRLLCVYPEERITAEDALKHPYFSERKQSVK